MRVSPILTNFTAGEWSPQLYGRVDLAQYPNACRTMKNFVPRVHGGAQKRPGTIFIKEIKDSSQAARLIPFQYSTSQAYVIEVGAAYMRFYKERARIDVLTVPYEIATPFGLSDIELIKYAQDKDLMYLFHRDYFPQKLTRYGHSDWELNNANFENGPYLPAQSADEVGTDLITNGDMEDNSDWAAISGAAPYYQGRSDDYRYKDTYAWQFVDNAADKGFKGATFTTVTDKNYVFRFRVYTAAGTMKIKIRKGDGSGWLYEETITGIPVHTWTEYERYIKETAGGSGAYVEFLTALTASATGYASEYPPAQSQVYVKATSSEDSHSQPYFATDPTMPLDGDASDRSWMASTATNQRYHIDLGEAKIIRRIYYENFHTSGEHISRGAKNFTLYGSNSVSSFEELTYGTDTGWTEINLASNAFAVHSAANAADPKYILVTATDKYRYYAFKFADNHGDGARMGFRRVELQDAEWVTDPNIYVDEVEFFKVNNVTMTPSAKTGNGITLTASDAYFEAGHVGAFFQLSHTSTTTTIGYCVIKSITSSTVAVADVVVDFGDTTATTVWREGAWSTKNGFPACGCFFEQRLICGSTDNDPDTIWGSKTTEYEDFEPGTAATDPITYKLQSDIIRWISAMGQLVVGTVNSEYRLGGQGSSDAVTPTNVKLTQQSRNGSADLDPVNLGNSILFSQRRGKASNYGTKLRALSYDYIRDAFQGVDLTLFAEHITGTGINKLAFMASPFPIVWAVTNDGDLIGLTFEHEQNVIGWHRHETDGTVEDICVIPGTNQDDLYMIVNRTIGGATKRYIEVMADFDWGTDDKDCFFVDCGITYDSTAATVISGLDHLEGETVAILADGVVQTAQAVTGGAITLTTAASVVQVGLPYTAVLAPMDLDGGAAEGSGQGKAKRIHGVAINLYKTLGGYIGADETTMEELEYPSTALYSGIKDDFYFPADWALEGRVVIKHTDPLPMTVLSIMPRFRTEDR